MRAKKERGCNLNRKQLHEVLPLNTPFTLNIAVSSVCNFKCNYCIHSLSKNELDKKNFKRENMNWDVFNKIIEDAKKFDEAFKVVTFTGTGEPLCNKNLPEMIKIVKQNDITDRTQFLTNGELLNEKLILELIDAGIDDIRISLQGLSGKKYKEICGKDIDFDKFVKNIEFLYNNKKDCKLYIKIIDIALDKGEEEQFYNIFSKICDKIFIEKALPIFDGVEYENLLSCEKKEILDNGKVINMYGEVIERQMVCPQPFFAITIWPDGEIYPCCMPENPCNYGNIKKEDLKEVWFGDKRKKFLMMQLNKDRLNNKICNECYYASLCQQEDNLDNYTDMLKSKFK